MELIRFSSPGEGALGFGTVEGARLLPLPGCDMIGIV